MRVAQINFQPAPPGWTPAEVLARWQTLVDVAEAVTDAGVEVSVLQAADRDARISARGVDYHFVDVVGMRSSRRKGARMAQRARSLAPELLHVHGLGFADASLALAEGLPGVPLLLQDHANRPPAWWRRPRWRRCHAQAAALAFTAAELAEPFRQAGLIGPGTEVHAVPESSTRFRPGDRIRARAETGIYGQPAVLWVGHLTPGKDPLTALDGVAMALERLPDLHLWCVFGNAPLLPAVRERISTHPGLSGCVHLIGSVPHHRVETLMQAADLFVSASHGESCGYAALEAMACGTAPVLTDIPAFRALTDRGRVGRLWRRGDAATLAQAVVAMAPVSETLSSRTRVRAHFDALLSPVALGRRWEAVYGQVVRRRQGTVP